MTDKEETPKTISRDKYQAAIRLLEEKLCREFDIDLEELRTRIITIDNATITLNDRSEDEQG